MEDSLDDSGRIGTGKTDLAVNDVGKVRRVSVPTAGFLIVPASAMRNPPPSLETETLI
jgi:hypothetical protein